MRMIGILGGMSAASTQIYYRELCELTRQRLGGLHSPELLIRSLDFARIEALQMKGEWDAAGVVLNEEARALERGGADLIVLATNTMHMEADQRGASSRSLARPYRPRPVPFPAQRRLLLRRQLRTVRRGSARARLVRTCARATDQGG